jgi:polyhydroxyalkanoate synthesis repressor PhaR
MRTIKRYSNRKLYDTKDKRYITLEQISALVRDGEDIRVIDNQSGEDLTTVTLSQVLLDQEKKKEAPLPKWAFLEMIQRSGTSVLDGLKKGVFSWFENSFVSDETIDKNVEKMVKGGQITKDEATKLKTEFKSRAGAFKKRLDNMVERRVDEILGALNIPSKSELGKLNTRLDELNSKVEELLSKQSGGENKDADKDAEEAGD